MSPQIRRIIGIVAFCVGALMLGKDGISWRPIGLFIVGALFIFLSLGDLKAKK
jgi:membrane-bound ClpP family serine protease